MRVVALLVAAAFLVPIPGWSQPSKGDKGEAQRLFRAGKAAYDEGRFGDAAEALDAAFAKFPVPEIAFSAAQAYRLSYFASKKVSALRRAVQLYRVYLKEVTRGGRRADAVANLAELEPFLARVSEAAEDNEPPKTPRTRLVISATTKGAEVSIDGGAFVPSSRVCDRDARGAPLSSTSSPTPPGRWHDAGLRGAVWVQGSRAGTQARSPRVA